MKNIGRKAFVPYSRIKETGSNVPSLKHFFSCLETSGTTLTDSKGGCVWQPSSVANTLSFDASLRAVYTDMTESNNPIPFTSGTPAVFNSGNSIVAVAVARTYNVLTTLIKCSIGDINNLLGYPSPQGIGMANSPQHVVVTGASGSVKYEARTIFNVQVLFGGSGYTAPVTFTVADSGGPGTGAQGTMTQSSGVVQNSAVLTNNGSGYVTPAVNITGGVGSGASAAAYRDFNTEGADIMMVTKYNPAASTLTYTIINPTTNVAYLATDTHVGVNNNAGVITPNPCFRFYGLKLYGYALFSFAAMPPDADIGCLWMAQDWINRPLGTRRIYPGWIGVV